MQSLGLVHFSRHVSNGQWMVGEIGEDKIKMKNLLEHIVQVGGVDKMDEICVSCCR